MKQETYNPFGEPLDKMSTVTGPSAEEVLGQIIGRHTVDYGLALARQTDNSGGGDKSTEEKREKEPELPISVRLKQYGAGENFVNLAAQMEAGLLNEDWMLTNALYLADIADEPLDTDDDSTTINKGLARLYGEFQRILALSKGIRDCNDPKERQLLMNTPPAERGYKNVDTTKPKLGMTLRNPGERQNIQEILDDVTTDDTTAYALNAGRVRALATDIRTTHGTLSFAADIAMYSEKATYMTDIVNKYMGQLLGDDYKGRVAAIREVIKKIGHIRSHKKTTEALRVVLDDAERMLLAGIEDIEQRHGIIDALEAKKADMAEQERLQQEREEQERQQAEDERREEERFLGGIDKAAVIENIGNVFEHDIDSQIDADANYRVDNEGRRGKRGNRNKGKGKNPNNFQPTEIRITPDKAETYKERLLVMGYKEEDIDMKKMSLLIRLKQGLGGMIYESLDPKSRGYLVWVGTYQGKTCAVAELPVYGTATRVWAGDDGDKWVKILKGGNLNEMDSHPVIHSHERDEKDSRSYTEKDSEAHIREVGRRIVNVAAGRTVKRGVGTKAVGDLLSQ